MGKTQRFIWAFLTCTNSWISTGWAKKRTIFERW